MASVASTRLNETFAVLTHPHRRYVLYYLMNESAVVDVDTLATAVARWDGSDDIETGLYHTHLPKLADAGIITFDPSNNSIELRGMDEVGQFLVDTAQIDGYPRLDAED